MTRGFLHDATNNTPVSLSCQRVAISAAWRKKLSMWQLLREVQPALPVMRQGSLLVMGLQPCMFAGIRDQG